MLLSMTGFGEAHAQASGLAVAVEVRTINSRHFKLSYRASEGYGALEPEIELLVRESIRRGTVQVNLHVDNQEAADEYRINPAVLDTYRRQLEEYQSRLERKQPVPIESLLLLPGVVVEHRAVDFDPHSHWGRIEPVVREALGGVLQMRADEGKSLVADLREQSTSIADSLEKIARRAPTVVEDYRQRLSDRVNRSLAELNITVDPADLVREVTLFTDRSDISEEIVRLRSHLQQFEGVLAETEGGGRKLEFIVQEMGRETNTIGSKANDAVVSQHVVDVKAALERIREQIQNIE